MLKRILLCVTSSHARIVDSVLEHSAPRSTLQLPLIGSLECRVLEPTTNALKQLGVRF
ncbi:hypothetical protein [Corynebacterium sp. MSK204]|uniref:hypothetical protein n=1 Tax=unclassified Corynebacterium TaxID=2624378 RepID=UPI00254ABA5A|nr:hypothetical protein [Corynebacterium sp. MSK204]MDK8658093.1 hypothetical protein [Corynebacterium sp. MSK204]